MIKIGGVTIKTPQGFNVVIEDVSNIDRNALGQTVIDRVAVKHRLDLAWGALTNTEISTILSAVAGPFFTVEYPDPQTGAVNTITGFMKSRSTSMSRYITGGIVWDNLKMVIEEQ